MISVYKQICFKITNPDLIDEGEEGRIYGGIGEYVDIDGEDILIQVICGCCGSIFVPKDIEVLEVYNHWVDLTDTIIGD